MRQVHEGLAKHGMGWLAIEQTAGKGQRGNQWISEPGKNIAMSVIIDISTVKMSSGFHLSACVSLACYELFAKYAGNETKIKWPNDIYWGDRKAGGMLIENIYQGQNWKLAIIGIGINLNQEEFSTLTNNPVSLSQITGDTYDLIQLADELYEALMRNIYIEFGKSVLTYNDHLYRKGEKVRLKKDNAVFETTIKGVNEFGQLMTEDVIERVFEFGEVEWLIVSSA